MQSCMGAGFGWKGASRQVDDAEYGTGETVIDVGSPLEEGVEGKAAQVPCYPQTCR